MNCLQTEYQIAFGDGRWTADGYVTITVHLQSIRSLEQGLLCNNHRGPSVAKYDLILAYYIPCQHLQHCEMWLFTFQKRIPK